ncbi:MAG: hypothetical protein V1929_11970 [bacterium]
MKTHLTLQAIAGACVVGLLSAVASHAQDAAYSINIVGFQKIAAPPQFNMASTPFDAEILDINQAIGPQLTANTDFTNADNILLWDAGAQQYKLLYLSSLQTNKWVDLSTGVSSEPILVGKGMFIRNRQAFTQSVVVAGDVVADAAMTNPVVLGFQMLAYPYSADIPLNSMAFTNGGFGSNNFNNSDNIYLWDSTNQQYRTYFLAGNVGNPAANYKWISVTPPGIASNVIVRTGDGFWYRHRENGFNWVEVNPYPNL